MQLRDYMRKRRLGDGEVAADLGVSRPTVTRWRNKKMLPTSSMAELIKAWSGGEVDADHWTERKRVINE